MKDKIQKIREGIEKLKSQLLRGACSSQIAMETRCKEEAYNEVLDLLDTMQEEPVSNVWHDMSEEAENGRNIIIIDPKGFYGAVLRKGGSQLRNHNKERYVKWAYIDDIINITNKEEPVSEIDFEQELYKAFGQVKDFTLGMQIAKWFYDMGKKNQEPVSEDLGEYINELSKQFPEVSFAKLSRIAVRVAKWQKANLWKPADGDDLPEIDREVIVLVKYSTQRNIHDEEYPTYRVGFGHRPDPKGWEGKSVTTGKVEHYTPKTYDKGGWNIPDIVLWLDVDIPKIEED